MTGGGSESDLASVTLSRRSTRGIILGLSLLQVLTLAIALATVVISLYAGGTTVLAYTAPLWVGCMVAAWLPIGGRTLIEWAPIAIVWVWRRARGLTSHRHRVLSPQRAGTLTLPGSAATLEEFIDPESGAVMLHDRQHRWLIAIAEISHRSLVLLDPATQQRQVTGWGRVLATVCRSGRIARIQVLERTIPGSGTGMADWWATNGTDDGSWVARTYADLIGRAGPAAERHQATISIALDLSRSRRSIRAAGGGITGAAQILGREMTTIATALRSADLTDVAWLTPDRLTVAIRSAYDPQVGSTLDRLPDGGSLANAGPVATEETWERLRTDSAWHAVLWINQWPRSAVYPGFLSPLLLTNGISRTFSLIAEPIRPDVAARKIRRAKTEYIADAAQRARIGQIDDAQQTAEYGDVLQQEADLTAGHGLLRYAGLLTISAPGPDRLDAAIAEVEQAAIQASSETRRLVGQQADAFLAAALPLCRGI